MKETYLISLSISLLLFLLLVLKLKEHKANVFLASFLLIIILGETINLLYSDNQGGSYLLVDIVSATPALMGVFSYLYVKYTIFNNEHIKKKEVLHAIPSVFAVCFNLYAYR